MEKITKIYVGKDRVCRCGCAGEYYYERDEKFAELVNRFEKSWKRYVKAGKMDPEYDEGDNYKNISFAGNRALTAYFD